MSDLLVLDDLTITPITIPATADGPDAADFRAAVDIRNRIGALDRGDDSVAVTAAQALPMWTDQTDEELHAWLIRTDGELVGRAMLYLPRETGSRRAQVRVDLLPEWWGRRIGRHVLDFAEDRAQDLGRDVLQSWSEHAAHGGDGEVVIARTGFGRVPRDHVAGFLHDAGYELEQVYRISTLDLTGPLDAIEPLLADARAAAAAYRYVSWVAPTPKEWVDDYAWMKSRMSTDAPSGESVMDEEVWDADRVGRMEARNAASGITTLVGAAQHIASGRLAAFTELESFRIAGAPIEQNDTLVLAEHRGHRLGALVKCEMLIRARELLPEGDRIVTGNAEENRPMLAINEAMGFRPTRYTGDWQKSVG